MSAKHKQFAFPSCWIVVGRHRMGEFSDTLETWEYRYMVSGFAPLGDGSGVGDQAAASNSAEIRRAFSLIYRRQLIRPEPEQDWLLDHSACYWPPQFAAESYVHASCQELGTAQPVCDEHPEASSAFPSLVKIGVSPGSSDLLNP